MAQNSMDCAGCGGIILPGEKVWLSDVGEEKNIITHPLADCLKKFIQPEETTILSIGETIVNG